MSLQLAEFDEDGNWTGTCAECSTSHDGWPPGTLGADVACLRALVARLTGPAGAWLRWRLRKLEDRLRRKRDAILRAGRW